MGRTRAELAARLREGFEANNFGPVLEVIAELEAPEAAPGDPVLETVGAVLGEPVAYEDEWVDRKAEELAREVKEAMARWMRSSAGRRTCWIASRTCRRIFRSSRG